MTEFPDEDSPRFLSASLNYSTGILIIHCQETLRLSDGTRNKILNLYSEKFGNKIENIVFYFVFGLFKIAVIVQQIFFRYKNGFTKDAPFKHLNLVVKAYSFLAIKSIEKQKIEL